MTDKLLLAHTIADCLHSRADPEQSEPGAQLTAEESYRIQRRALGAILGVVCDSGMMFMAHTELSPLTKPASRFRVFLGPMRREASQDLADDLRRVTESQVCLTPGLSPKTDQTLTVQYEQKEELVRLIHTTLRRRDRPERWYLITVSGKAPDPLPQLG